MPLIQIIFIAPLVRSIFAALSASSPIYLWAALEINTISFIPIIISSLAPESLRAAIKYFFIQAYASVALLIGPVMNLPFSLSLTIAMLAKIGAAPFHNWYPSVISNIQWSSIFILSTVQKIAPLWILIDNLRFSPLISLLAGVNAIVGGIGGLAQSDIRNILAFSSIGHIGWIIYAILFSQPTTLIYYVRYLLHLTLIIYTFIIFNIYSPKDVISISSVPKFWKILIFLSLLSIGGLPPLLGFIPKLIILNLSAYSTIIPMLLILGSYLNIYFYINLLWSSFMVNPTTFNLLPLNKIFVTFFCAITLSTLLILVYGLNIHLQP